jgi:ribonuclease BN (tRNA processing enzyme)
MKLILLGTGGYFPTSRRYTACFMLPEVGVVLDAGSGMCRIGKHLATDRLDIFLSHAHLDHILGLTYLVNLVPENVLARTTVHGDAKKLEAVREHLFADAIFPVAPPFRFVPLTTTCPLPSGGTLDHFSLTHPGGSLGFRLDWPSHSMAYVTDTTAIANANYIRNIQGVNLLVHECYFATDEKNLPAKTGHSSLLTVAKLAADANVGSLVLVHLDPMLEDDRVFDLDAAKAVFPNIEIGMDGAQLEF